MDVTTIDRTAILARNDQSPADRQPFNAQQRDFATNAVIPTLAGPFTVLGGWSSVDAKRRGSTFR